MSVVLSEHLPLLASAPDGIKKLRGLILELAVRGKLVPQDPKDEPASELLKRIAAEKARLVDEGKIRKDKPLPPVGEDEKPFELPVGWQWIRFGDLLDFQGGGQPPKNNFSDNELPGYVQLIQIRDLGEKPQPVYIKRELASKFCTPDDIMVGRYGASVGKVFWGKHGAYNVALVKMIDEHKAFNSGFLFRLLRSPLGQSFFLGISRSAQDGFNKSDIEKKLVPLCPIPEQHRIVAKVDELIALCDRMEAEQADAEAAQATLVQTLLGTLTQSRDAAELAANWQRMSQHFDTLFTTEASLDALKQTILQLVVMGKLVPQDPNDEPASELLKRIAAEKARLVAEGKIKKGKPLPPVGEAEKPFALPAGWMWSRIGSYLLSTDYGLSEKTFDLPDGVPVLKMGDIQAGQVILGGQKKVPLQTEGLPELLVKRDDLLYNRTNSAELVGKTGIFTGEGEYTFASYLIRLRCLVELVSASYLNLAMNAPFFRATQIFPLVKQQCGQANVNGSLLRNMLVPIPPANEQHRIVAKVDELMALCDSLKADLAESRARQARLATTLIESALQVAGKEIYADSDCRSVRPFDSGDYAPLHLSGRR